MFVRVCVDVCVCVVCLVPPKKCQLLSFHLSFAFFFRVCVLSVFVRFKCVFLCVFYLCDDKMTFGGVDRKKILKNIDVFLTNKGMILGFRF